MKTMIKVLMIVSLIGSMGVWAEVAKVGEVKAPACAEGQAIVDGNCTTPVVAPGLGQQTTNCPAIAGDNKAKETTTASGTTGEKKTQAEK